MQRDTVKREENFSLMLSNFSAEISKKLPTNFVTKEISLSEEAELTPLLSHLVLLSQSFLNTAITDNNFDSTKCSLLVSSIQFLLLYGANTPTQNGWNGLKGECYYLHPVLFSNDFIRFIICCCEFSTEVDLLYESLNIASISLNYTGASQQPLTTWLECGIFNVLDKFLSNSTPTRVRKFAWDLSYVLVSRIIKPTEHAFGFTFKNPWEIYAVRTMLKLFNSFTVTFPAHYPFMPEKHFEVVVWPLENTKMCHGKLASLLSFNGNKFARVESPSQNPMEFISRDSKDVLVHLIPSDNIDDNNEESVLHVAQAVTVVTADIDTTNNAANNALPQETNVKENINAEAYVANVSISGGGVNEMASLYASAASEVASTSSGEVQTVVVASPATGTISATPGEGICFWEPVKRRQPWIGCFSVVGLIELEHSIDRNNKLDSADIVAVTADCLETLQETFSRIRDCDPLLLRRDKSAPFALQHNCSRCESCQIKFAGLLNLLTGSNASRRRHHCRICGSSVCDSCSNENGYNSERACNKCLESLTRLGIIGSDRLSISEFDVDANERRCCSIYMPSDLKDWRDDPTQTEEHSYLDRLCNALSDIPKNAAFS